jgi:hypothetical protein
LRSLHAGTLPPAYERGVNDRLNHCDGFKKNVEMVAIFGVQEKAVAATSGVI